jgi:uncharacterized delta-60 repeat protein
MRNLVSQFRCLTGTVECLARTLSILAMIALLLCWSIPLHVQAAAGDLDLTFGSGGKVLTDFFGSTDSIQDIVLQPDGKIVAAGGAFGSGFALARYNADGSLDTTFGTGGKVITALGSIADLIRAVALQSDGKIIVVGDAFTNPSGGNFVLVRYNADGSLDSTFGSGGKVIDSLTGNNSSRDIAVQSDGKIIVAWISGDFAPGGDFNLGRYNPDGSLDTTFGSGGKVTTDFFGNNDSVNSIVLQSDGKIIAGGTASSFINLDGSKFAIARYNVDGSLDTTFGLNGRATTDFFGQNSVLQTIALQPNGKIIAGGTAANDFALASFNADGSLDLTFGSGGKVTTDFSGTDQVRAIAVQSNGKIIAGGYDRLFTNTSDFVIARYNPDGSLDPTFGINGKAITDFGGRDTAFTMALQPDGKIIQAGSASASGPENDFALVRYDGDAGTFDHCIQDDSNSSIFQFNSTTGEYQFTICSSLVIGGTGSVTQKGGIITLQHNAPGRRVLARVITSVNKATATIQLLSQGTTFTITDRNTANNTCACR